MRSLRVRVNALDLALYRQVRSVARLVASEATLRDVVTYEQTRFLATKRALLVVTGRVSAGFVLDGYRLAALAIAAR